MRCLVATPGHYENKYGRFVLQLSPPRFGGIRGLSIRAARWLITVQKSQRAQIAQESQTLPTIGVKDGDNRHHVGPMQMGETLLPDRHSP